MKTYLGLILAIGIVDLLNMHGAEMGSLKYPEFTVMTCNQFFQMMSNLHLCDNAVQSETDHLYKQCELPKVINQLFSKWYINYQEIF